MAGDVGGWMGVQLCGRQCKQGLYACSLDRGVRVHRGIGLAFALVQPSRRQVRHGLKRQPLVIHQEPTGGGSSQDNLVDGSLSTSLVREQGT